MRSAYRTALDLLQPMGLLLATGLLAACAPAAPRAAAAAPPCPPSPQHSLDERGMMAYQGCLGALSPQQLAQEHEAVDRHFAQTGSGADRVKLALLLSVPGTPFHSTAAARQQLGAAAQNGGAPGSQASAVPPELRGLAQLLEGALAQQQALEDRVQSLEKDLAAEKQRSEALQAQIDSIKNLERNMTRRGPR